MFLNSFRNRHHVKILVENDEGCVGIVSVKYILENIIRHTISTRAGVLYKWDYRKKTCYALLELTGEWKLYAVAPMEFVDDARPNTYYDTPVNYLMWDDDNYMYRVNLDTRENVSIPEFPFNATTPGYTFKDLSYCVAYVNSFVDRIRR